MTNSLNARQFQNCDHTSNPQMMCSRCAKEIIDKGHQIHEQKLEEILLDKKVKNALIPVDLKDKDLNNFHHVNEEYSNIVAQVKNYTEQILEGKRSSNLIINGPTGVGKSHLAVGILKYCYELKKFKKSIRYSTSFGLANKVIATWSDPDLSEESIYQEYTEIDFLIIDDLGYADNGKKSEIINKIIYRRHENQKNTIITSNLTTSQIIDYMDSRTCSRFLSRLYDHIEMNSEDFRLIQ